jgi:hypothetical protein
MALITETPSRRGGPGMNVGPRRHVVGGRFPGLVLALAAGVLCLTCCSSSSHQSISASGSGRPVSATACAWPAEDNYQVSNISLPDAAASEWLQPFAIQKGGEVIFSGVYPDARYASFSVYTSGEVSFTSNGVGSSLPDYQIEPDTGSRNPWQQQAATGGHFQITLRPNALTGQVNVLPIAPPGTTTGEGYVVYRVYLPADPDFSKLTLPTVTLQLGASTHILPVCATHTMALPTPVASPTTTQPASSGAVVAQPGPLQFYKPVFGSYFPNPETGYVLARFTPPTPSDVVVVTGRGPTFAPGDHPSPWPATSEQLRYWSMCVNVGTATLPVVVNPLSNGQTDTGCRADDATALNSQGDYTYVIGTEAQRAAIERVPGVTFLPLSSAQPTTIHLLTLRNTLVSPSFTTSAQNVSQTGSPAAAAAVMGAYYPVARVCALSILTAAGPQACA